MSEIYILSVAIMLAVVSVTVVKIYSRVRG